MNHSIGAPATTKLATAIEDNLINLYAYWGNSPQAEAINTPNLVSLASSVRSPTYNAVARTNLGTQEAALRISELRNYYRSRGVPMLWWVGPSSQPDDLGKLLEQVGLREGPALYGVAGELHDLPEQVPTPSNLVIERVNSSAQLALWGQGTVGGYGASRAAQEQLLTFEESLGVAPASPWQRFVALIEGRPVGALGLFLGAGVAGIYGAATLPELRGQGIGTAMTITALQHARTLGYQVGVFQSAYQGSAAWTHVGFRQYCTFHVYLG